MMPLLVVVAVATAVVLVDSKKESPDLTTKTSDQEFGDEPTQQKTRQTVVPADIIDLKNWKLTLPIETQASGNPDEIKQPELSDYSNQNFFYPNLNNTGVIFRANAGGAATSGSNYSRSELREMRNNGTERASWSNMAGSHTMSITQAITSLPKVKAQVVAGQIHDAKDDVLMIRLENKRLFVEAGGKEIGLLDDKYKLGVMFKVDITATAQGIRVMYNG
ncbi:polysaccharide lyase family 7 protein, partial [Candidatus Saccharibacteria bacterium]|nr:polysaccharide lyase family 7 protein [Candidatus Saccharibacteria bacterium]